MPPPPSPTLPVSSLSPPYAEINVRLSDSIKDEKSLIDPPAPPPVLKFVALFFSTIYPGCPSANNDAFYNEMVFV